MAVAVRRSTLDRADRPTDARATPRDDDDDEEEDDDDDRSVDDMSSNKPCYKCGRTGHWARDCTASAEEQISKDEADALRDADAGAKEAREAERASGGDANAPTSATKRSRAVSATKRPKFSVHDHLLGPNGLAVVYETFPAKYRERAKGEGHEAHDFNLLISMYKEWAIKMYPYAPADETLARVDKLGKDKTVRMAVREFHERDFGGGVGEAMAAMERGDGVEADVQAEDLLFPDDEEEDGGNDAAKDDEDDVPFPDDVDEEDYVFDDDDDGEDEDAARAMQEAEEADVRGSGDAAAAAAVDDGDDDEDEDEEPTGKRGKKVKGESASTKSAFAHLAKKLGKTVEAPKESVAVDEENHPNLVNSPQRKVLRMRPKCLDASSDEDDEPAEPMRRRRAVHGMDDEEDED